MKIRSGLAAVALLTALCSLTVGTASPAAARWLVHNGNDATDPIAPNFGADGQTCSNRVRGHAGWTDFVLSTENPATHPVPADAFLGVPYLVYGVYDGHQADDIYLDEEDPDHPVARYFSDQTLVPVIEQFTTPARTAVSPPVRAYPEDTSGDAIYVFTTTTFDAALPPGAVAPGDQIALRPVTGFAFLGLDVIPCDTAAPTCAISNRGTDEQAAVLHDDGRGFASVVATRKDNATTSVPSFSAGATQVIAVAHRTATNKVARVTFTSTDREGNSSLCFFLFTSIPATAPQTLTRVASTAHVVTLTNRNGGAGTATVTVNGVAIPVSLAAGAKKNIGIGAQMDAGNENTVKLAWSGSGTVDVLLFNGSTSTK